MTFPWAFFTLNSLKQCLTPRYSDTPTVLISLWCGGLFCAVLTIAVTVYNVRRHYESAREQGLGRLTWNQLCAVSTDGSDNKRFRMISIVIEGQRWLSWLNAWNMFEECHIIWHHITSYDIILHHISSYRFFFIFVADVFSYFFAAGSCWDTMKCCRPSVPELIGSCSCCWSQPSGPSPPLRRCSCLGQLRPFDKQKIWGICSICSGWGYCNWEVTDKLFMILSWDCHDTDGCVNDATWYATWYNNAIVP